MFGASTTSPRCSERTAGSPCAASIRSRRASSLCSASTSAPAFVPVAHRGKHQGEYSSRAETRIGAAYKGLHGGPLQHISGQQPLSGKQPSRYSMITQESGRWLAVVQFQYGNLAVGKSLREFIGTQGRGRRHDRHIGSCPFFVSACAPGSHRASDPDCRVSMDAQTAVPDLFLTVPDNGTGH